jgi:hypothetical protein
MPSPSQEGSKAAIPITPYFAFHVFAFFDAELWPT